MDASALHCPNCGAAVEPDAGRCPYCKARLATVSCPSCFALGFDGAAYCHKCGAARTRTDHETTAARCPGCKSELQRVDVGTTPLYECAACDGIWVDADVFERLCASRESQAAVLPRLSPQQPVKTAAAVRYRPCVRCGKMMNRINFGGLSGAIVDVCKGHGTFVDHGELHQIVSFVHSGGLERARARRKEELRDEERRLRDLEARASRNAARASTSEHWHVDAGDFVSLIDLITGH